ncbi:MAG: SDR family NAD(P)-dependent oxidoreductase [Planctomycetota bacterium]|nr:MAG: SDR family NAD(P)-dependent oxidoreductase [Planctomycetota bacterium]
MTQRTIVVTGASAGVGRAVARAFGQRGDRVALLARGQAGLEGARADVEQLGGEALVLPTDVAEASQVEAAAAEAEQRFGPIDVWINSAMVSVFSPAQEIQAEEFERVTRVTYLGCVNGTLTALRSMTPRDHGAIVQVGSALAYRGIPLQSAYCGAKHAIQGFTESVRCELLHDQSQVKLSVVHLPAVNTPQFDWVKCRLPHKPQPVPPIYQPEVAAEAIVWAADHYRREWRVGASTAVVIAGNKLAPGLGDRYLASTGYGSQQYDGDVEPDRQDNLFAPQDDVHDHGARGEFSDRARTRSWQFWASKHRKVLSWTAAATGGALVAWSARGARQR